MDFNISVLRKMNKMLPIFLWQEIFASINISWQSVSESKNDNESAVDELRLRSKQRSRPHVLVLEAFL